MDILALKFASVPLYWLLVFGVSWFVYRFCVVTRVEFLDWQERRARKKEYEAMKPLRDEQDRLGLKLAEEMRDVIQHELDQGTIMAKRKKGSKVQSRAKLRRAISVKRGKARKAAKRTVAKARPKPAPVKKAARKVKQPVAPVVLVETVAAEVTEQPAPGMITVTEIEETEVRKAS